MEKHFVRIPHLLNTNHIQDWQRIRKDFYGANKTVSAPTDLHLQVQALEVMCRRVNLRLHFHDNHQPVTMYFRFSRLLNEQIHLAVWDTANLVI